MDALHLYSYGKIPFTPVLENMLRNPSSTSEPGALKLSVLNVAFFFFVASCLLLMTSISESTEYLFSLPVMEFLNSIREVCCGESCGSGSKMLTAPHHSFFDVGV